MAFKLIGSLNPHGGPVLRTEITAASIELTELDATIASSGFVALGTAGTLVLGHIKSIVTYDGVGVTSDGAGGTFSGTYTTSADNTTVLKTSVTLDVSKETLYSVDPDATIGTNDSELMGYHIDLADEQSTDEDTATTATAQYTQWGVDPADSGNQVVNIYESVIFGV